MPSTSEPATADVVDRLEAAAADLADAEAAVEAVGGDDAERVADAVASAERLLERYRDSATGTGDFQAYLEFQERVAELVEDLPEDLPEREAFEAYEAAVDGRRLSGSDFERAREALEPAEAVAGRLDDRRAALEAYREARRAVRERRDAVDERIAELREVAALGDADVDAPVERLRDPIEAYDEAVRAAFRTFKREAPAREVLDLVATASERPLVDFEAPPGPLREFVAEDQAGTEPVVQLLEYADHSRSKLDHYVDSADELKRVVATRQTYLSRLDADPLTVGWPPPEAPALRRLAREYESVVRRFADEDVVARCRTVRTLTRREDYADLRRAATAREELTDAQRRKLADGTVDEELAEREAERERLADALAEHPER